MNTTDQTTRLPIFISYGHKSHEETVLKIKEALEARGHKIWIDTEGITEGTDWRRKIYDGILHSQLFLAFVSKKSVESEYCQTEIRIAVGAPQNLLPVCPLMLEQVDVPQSISHIQTVNFVYDENDPAAFEKGLKQVIDWIDMDEHVAFCEEMEDLREKFGRPESFEARLRVLMSQPFVGRKWLLEKINEWDKGDSRLFGIIGGPGFGKSIFAANLRSLAPEKVAAAQFIEWDKTAKYAPKQIIKSLAFQLAARITQYRELLIDTVKEVDLDSLDESSLFDKLLSEPLAFENPNNTYWVILDALDEATARDGQNPFVQTLMRNMDQLPKWLKFIVTSRPDATVVTYLKNRGIQLFDTDAQIRQSQHDDMMEYLHEELKDCGFSDDVLEGLISKSQGMFLYLHFVCQDIKLNKLSAAAISQLPAGIDAIYQQYFDRQFGGERYAVFTSALRPVLRLYCSALEPLPLDFIAEALGKSVDDVRGAIDRLGTLKTYSSEDGRDYFTLAHKSIWDWLSTQPNDSTMQTFRVAPEDGLPALKEFCLKKINGYKPEQLRKDANCEYPLKHIVEHLVALDDLETVWELLGGEKPSLSQKQLDYFGNYNVAMASLEQAIVFYLEKYLAEKSHAYLPRACRLLVSFQALHTQRKECLRDLFKPGNTLKQVLEMMEGITDVRQYFMVGCYLLTKAAAEHWGIGALVEAIVDKCKDRIPKLSEANFHCLFFDQNQRFLVYGVFLTYLEQEIPDELVEQLLSCLSKDDYQDIGEFAMKVMETPQARFADDPFAGYPVEKYKDDILEDAAFEQEKQRILAIEDIEDRISELKILARYLAVKNHGDRAEELLHLLEDEYEKSSDFKEAPLQAIIEHFNMYNLAGKTEAGKSYLLSKERIFSSKGCETLFLGELCKVGLYEDAYSRFEAMTIKSLTKSGKKVEQLVSPFKILGKLCEKGDWERVRELVQDMMEQGRLSEDFGNYTVLFANLLEKNQGELVQELLLALLEKCENPMESLLHSPGLLCVMKKLKEKELWDDEIPKWEELKESFESSQQRQMTLADCYKLWPQMQMIYESDWNSNELYDIQFSFLKSAWEAFVNPPEKTEGSEDDADGGDSDEMPKDKSFEELMAELEKNASSAGVDGFDDFLEGLGDVMKGFGAMNVSMEDIFGDGGDDLNRIVTILDGMPRSEENPKYRELLTTCFTYLAGQAAAWEIDKNKDALSLLLKYSDYLPEEVFSELVEMLYAKLASTESSDYSAKSLIDDLIGCLYNHGMKEAAMEFIGELQDESNREEALEKCLKLYSKEEKLPEIRQLLEEGTFTDAQRVKALLELLHSLLSDCKFSKEKDAVGKTILGVLELLEKYFSPTEENLNSLSDKLVFFGGMYDIRQMPAVQKVIEFITRILTDVIQAGHFEQLPSSFEYKLGAIASLLPYKLTQQIFQHLSFSDNKKADVFLEILKQNDGMNDNLYAETAALIRGIKDKGEQGKYMTELLSVCLQKKYKPGVDECLDNMDSSVLVANADKLRNVSIADICHELGAHNIQPQFIVSVLSELSLANAEFDDLCSVSPYLLSDDKCGSKLIRKIAEVLLEANDLETLKEIALTCPELGIAYLFEEPAVSVSIDDILELRRQLAEEEITRKGYNKKIAELLEGVSEDVKARFDALEKQLDEEEITPKGYAKQLADIF